MMPAPTGEFDPNMSDGSRRECRLQRPALPPAQPCSVPTRTPNSWPLLIPASQHARRNDIGGKVSGETQRSSRACQAADLRSPDHLVATKKCPVQVLPSVRLWSRWEWRRSTGSRSTPTSSFTSRTAADRIVSSASSAPAGRLKWPSIQPVPARRSRHTAPSRIRATNTAAEIWWRTLLDIMTLGRRRLYQTKVSRGHRRAQSFEASLCS